MARFFEKVFTYVTASSDPQSAEIEHLKKILDFTFPNSVFRISKLWMKLFYSRTFVDLRSFYSLVFSEKFYECQSMSDASTIQKLLSELLCRNKKNLDSTFSDCILTRTQAFQKILCPRIRMNNWQLPAIKFRSNKQMYSITRILFNSSKIYE